MNGGRKVLPGENIIRPKGHTGRVGALVLAALGWLGAIVTGLVAVMSQNQRGLLVLAALLVAMGGGFTYASLGLQRLELHWDSQRIWDTGTRVSDSMLRSELAAIYRGKNMAFRGLPVWGLVSKTGKVAMQEPSDFTEDQMADLAGNLGVPLRGNWRSTLADQVTEDFSTNIS